MLVETPNPKEGGGLESKVARLEWIMSDIQMQMRGLNRGQQVRCSCISYKLLESKLIDPNKNVPFNTRQTLKPY